MRDDKPVNRFKVSKKMWSRWTLVGRHVFNKTYETMRDNQDVMKSNKTQGILDPEWDVIAWNAAFTAADVCSRGERHLIDHVIKEIKGWKPKELRPR
jgi:hypothetical protein